MLTEGDARSVLVELGVAHPSGLSAVSGGWDTDIWRVQADGQTYALRVFRPEQLRTWRRETVALRAAAEHGVAVPALHGATVWRDRPALLLGWCGGTTVLARARARPHATYGLGVAMGRTHAHIHRVPAPAALGAGSPAWLDRLQGEAALRARLRALAPAEGSLLHLDYHPLNVMCDAGGVTGVLDWANAGAGDPRADLARTVSILRLSTAPPGTNPLLDWAGRALLELGWRAGYRQVSGWPTNMAPFYAWAGAWMAQDLAPKLGRPGVWLRPDDLERMRRWAGAWKRRAGVVE